MTVLDRFWAVLGAYLGGMLGDFWGMLGLCWVNMGPFWVSFEALLRLVSYFGLFRCYFGPFWVYLDADLSFSRVFRGEACAETVAV